MSDVRERISFSTALLAGGKSSRMGRDKALLPSPRAGVVLWRHQWETLAALHPVEMLWSGPDRPGLPANARWIDDFVTNAGPLAGIAACLEAMSTDLLVVLAVDLPRINMEFLAGMLARSSPTSGAVARGENFFEPLAAVYPRRLVRLAQDHLACGRYALQDFVRAAVAENALQVVPLIGSEQLIFQNLNSPSDLEPEPNPSDRSPPAEERRGFFPG